MRTDEDLLKYPLLLLNKALTKEKLALDKYKKTLELGWQKDFEQHIIKTHIPNGEKRIESLEKAVGVLNEYLYGTKI